MIISSYKKGVTLIEVIVSVAIFAILSVSIFGVFTSIINGITYYREKTTISALADQYLEVVRNLPYSKLGTVEGNPNGSLPDLPNPLTVWVAGKGYNVYYAISYVDDPADGTALRGDDLAPNDYKQIKLYIKNLDTNEINSFLTNVSPKGLEGLVSGGALSLQIFDAVGQPVSGATIHITNQDTTPNVNLTRVSDDSGNWIEVGLPNSANSYHVVVSKNGYSSDQTYSISEQNPSPTKPDATILNGQVTQISFAIDKLSTLTFKTLDQSCAPISGVGLEVYGSKLIGTPNKVKFDSTYVSYSSGRVSLAGTEWDNYTPILTSPSIYMVYGSSPIQQVSILPGTSQSFNLILGPKTGDSLLAIVKDSVTGNPIESAQVQLQSANAGYGDAKLTSGSVWNQHDWSMGSGHDVFVDPAEYYEDDGNISNNETPLGLRLANLGNSYVYSGSLVSSYFDTGTGSTAYTTLAWQPTSQDPSTSIKFQLAASNDKKTWNYLGPDGTSESYYDVPGTTIRGLNGNRYVRYKVFLSTTDNSKTPVLTSVNINYVSGCMAPGQAMFPGLRAQNDYSAIISKNGYQSQTIDDIKVDGYKVLQILLNH